MTSTKRLGRGITTFPVKHTTAPNTREKATIDPWHSKREMYSFLCYAPSQWTSTAKVAANNNNSDVDNLATISLC